jgi:HPt (histidine-containing phosphotransfer) domain-containing protein
MTETMTSLLATLDTSYRKMVRDAAGQPYLEKMSADCLQTVQALLDTPPEASEPLRRQAHRLAGGTATVGLPALSAALKALEKASVQAPAVNLEPFYSDCRDGLRSAYEALATEASTLSSR